MGAGEDPSKRQVFEAFLRAGWVSLHLDARHPGVKLPPALIGTPHLILQYGHGMPVPIADLSVGDQGVAATLSFARTPHATFVPWAATYALSCTDGRSTVFDQDVPDDVRIGDASEAGRARNAAALAPGGDPATKGGSAAGRAVPSSAALPPEAAENAGKAPAGVGRGRKRAAATPASRHLQAVPAASDDHAGGDATATKAQPRTRRRPTLRLVK